MVDMASRVDNDGDVPMRVLVVTLMLANGMRELASDHRTRFGLLLQEMF